MCSVWTRRIWRRRAPASPCAPFWSWAISPTEGPNRHGNVYVTKKTLPPWHVFPARVLEQKIITKPQMSKYKLERLNNSKYEHVLDTQNSTGWSKGHPSFVISTMATHLQVEDYSLGWCVSPWIRRQTTTTTTTTTTTSHSPWIPQSCVLIFL